MNGSAASLWDGFEFTLNRHDGSLLLTSRAYPDKETALRRQKTMNLVKSVDHGARLDNRGEITRGLQSFLG